MCAQGGRRGSGFAALGLERSALERSLASLIVMMQSLLCLVLLLALLPARSLAAGHLHNPLHAFRADRASRRPDPEVLLSAAPLQLEQSGDWVTVSWSGVHEPSYDDRLVLVVPADADLSETAPAKIRSCSEDATFMETGGGSTR